MECHTAGSFFLDVLKTFAALLALVTAFVAYRVYRFNSRLERAKWLNTLYEKFYEKNELKKVRDILDCDSSESPAVEELVRSESKEFTDYLNFFEFIAVLSKSKQLAEGGWKTCLVITWTALQNLARCGRTSPIKRKAMNISIDCYAKGQQ